MGGGAFTGASTLMFQRLCSHAGSQRTAAGTQAKDGLAWRDHLQRITAETAAFKRPGDASVLVYMGPAAHTPLLLEALKVLQNLEGDLPKT
jgi:hypothetical protein